VYYVERGDSPKMTIVTKDEDGNNIIPSETPKCLIYRKTQLIDTLSVSGSGSDYLAFWTVPLNAVFSPPYYTAEWSWTYGLRKYVKRDKIYVYHTGVKES